MDRFSERGQRGNGFLGTRHNFFDVALADPGKGCRIGADQLKAFGVDLIDGQRAVHGGRRQRDDLSRDASADGQLVDALERRQGAVAVEANDVERGEKTGGRHAGILESD